MTEFASIAELSGATGTRLSPGDWVSVDQGRIDRFADATEDRQWLHVDQVRAAAGPFGTTIAHGYLMLSLLPVLTRGLYSVVGIRATINYGLNRVRFPSAIPSGSRVRAEATIVSVTARDDGADLVLDVTVSVEGASQPCCVAQTISRIQF